MGLEEYFCHLFHPFKPLECPERPPDEFNMAMFQVHIMRAKVILEQMNDLLDLYLYTVSWKDPLLTLGSLIVMVLLCVRFNTEYIGRYGTNCMLVMKQETVASLMSMH